MIGSRDGRLRCAARCGGLTSGGSAEYLVPRSFVADEGLLIGVVIGSYQLGRKLGEGGMGAVYLGQHTLLGRRAAIKVLLPMLSARPDIVSRFFNEARAVTTISDPGIVQVFDFGYHTDGSAFIVMEFLEGEPLD